MGKFVIGCPSCGKYTEASNFIFAKKTIDCACGYTINVKTDKISSKTCAHCGNLVVYDQSKGEKAICPVCHEKINTRDSIHNLIEFSCPSCSCGLSTDKNVETYICPLCDTQIDVQQQFKKELIKKKGLASVIKYEGPNDVFVWKHPIEDFNLGSQLIVHEAQEAIFFQDGRALDLFGAGRYTLATQNLPLLEELYKFPTNADTIFHSEIYFINMTTQMGVKWGTDSKVRLFDPASGLHIEIGACGNFNIKVNSSRKLLLKVVGTETELIQGNASGEEGYEISSMLGKFKALIMNKVKVNLARVIKELSINILEIDSYMDVLSERMKDYINEVLDEYGLVMPEFFITTILTPDDDPNYKRLKQQFADRTLKIREEEIRKAEAEAAQGRRIVEAQTEAQIKLLGAQADTEAYKMQAFVEAEEMRMKGYSYQQETARQVALEAMQNGITSGGDSGGSGIGDIAGLGVTLGAMGGVIGMTKDALSPIMGNSVGIGAGFGNLVAGNTPLEEKTVSCKMCGWGCPECGTRDIISKFCPECGKQKPEETKQIGWECLGCGTKGIISKFCPECGTKKPEDTRQVGWECPECGTKGITSKFCPECGNRREEESK